MGSTSRENKERKNMMMQSEHSPKEALETTKSEAQEWLGKSEVQGWLVNSLHS
jgi:hypothetical protein